jgi:hypothetical protein
MVTCRPQDGHPGCLYTLETTVRVMSGKFHYINQREINHHHSLDMLSIV